MATFQPLEIEPHESAAALSELEDAERRLGFRLPASVREWYRREEAMDILAKYSNHDRPIPLREFAVTEWKTHHLLPFKSENQGVCVWDYAFVFDQPASCASQEISCSAVRSLSTVCRLIGH